MNSGVFSPKAVLFFHTVSRAILKQSQSKTLPCQYALVTSSQTKLLQDPARSGICQPLWPHPLFFLPLFSPSRPPGLPPIPRNHQVSDSGPPHWLFPLPRMLFPRTSADPSSFLQVSAPMPPPQEAIPNDSPKKRPLPSPLSKQPLPCSSHSQQHLPGPEPILS